MEVVSCSRKYSSPGRWWPLPPLPLRHPRRARPPASPAPPYPPRSPTALLHTPSPASGWKERTISACGASQSRADTSVVTANTRAPQERRPRLRSKRESSAREISRRTAPPVRDVSTSRPERYSPPPAREKGRRRGSLGPALEMASVESLEPLGIGVATCDPYAWCETSRPVGRVLSFACAKGRPSI